MTSWVFVMETESRERQETSALVDTVALLSDMPARGLVRGQVGAVVEALDQETLLVEFSDDEGRAYAIASCPRDDLLFLRTVPARRNWSFLGQGVPDPARPHPAFAVASRRVQLRLQPPALSNHRSTAPQHRARERFAVGRISPCSRLRSADDPRVASRRLATVINITVSFAVSGDYCGGIWQQSAARPRAPVRLVRMVSLFCGQCCERIGSTFALHQ